MSCRDGRWSVDGDLQVLTAIQTLEFDMPKSTNDLGTVEQLMAEAYKEIDKAVVNGTLHKNNGARKKSRLGRAKVKLLVDAGLYTPQPATAWWTWESLDDHLHLSMRWQDTIQPRVGLDNWEKSERTGFVRGIKHFQGSLVGSFSFMLETNFFGMLRVVERYFVGD